MSGTRIFTTERLALRELATDDAGFILELTNDADWLRFIGDRGIRNLDDARRYIETGPRSMYAEHGFGLYAVEGKDAQVAIGLCGLLRRPWLDHPDLGFAFLPSARGRGFAFEAAAATLAHAKSALNFGRVLAIVTPGNAPSIRVLEKLGMHFERMARPAADEQEVCVYG